jgi:hypothetical protein
MSKQHFRDHRFSPEAATLLQQCIEIIEGYMQQGLRLTLRQTYYQCVVRNLFPNSEKSYKKLSALLSDARLAGLVDWEAIEDRVRVPVVPQEFRDLKELAEVALNAYRLPRWADQDFYVEVAIEKDALSGVLRPIAREFHVTMSVNRGYVSQSAMYDSAGRFMAASDAGKECKLFYLGDHDPSGEDMVRDIRDRLEMFGATVEVEKIGLTMAQVERYNPPPNPAKLTDPRSAEYVDKHGAVSWEVDALPPEVLNRLVRGSITEILDVKKMDAIKRREEADKRRLLAAVREIVGEKKS